FGTSQFVEAARYHHALEAELSRTISSLRNIRSARVHLALPKQSVFVRDRISPSASVVVDLLGGEGINNSSVASIVHLVSSSVPYLTAQQVTVVDQNGRLLSDASSKENGVAMSSKQYQYTRQLEMDLVRRIEMLLTPIIGVGKVRAEVNALVDFDAIETTSENYDPEKRIVRSEQTSENRKASGTDAEGIPGALSNQPPDNANLTENTEIAGAAKTDVINSSRNAVRNFELDRTISHTKRGNGAVKRLTVAVLVDHALLPDDAIVPAAPPAAGQPATPAAATNTKPKLVRRALNAEEIQRLTLLVQETIGFSEQRGDRVNVISESFIDAEVIAPIETAFYEKDWFLPVLKQAGGALLVLYVIFGVLKPSLKNLSNYRPPVVINAADEDEDEEGLEGEVVRNEKGEIVADGKQEIPMPDDHDNKIEFAQRMVEHDPRRVAKVVKEWVANG
ncbi:MAG: flagellar basal-body MS-ring/collar protein FliF, partial [Gammaproteobacteria bacterium]|nr:flagellar basal-body MS-ring/collar protein FliF [Gammaproteobacteria bacterium]